MIGLDHLGLENLEDPNSDRILFWNESAVPNGTTDWLEPGNGLGIAGYELYIDLLNTGIPNTTVNPLSFYAGELTIAWSAIPDVPATETKLLSYEGGNIDGDTVQWAGLCGTGIPDTTVNPLDFHAGELTIDWAEIPAAPATETKLLSYQGENDTVQWRGIDETEVDLEPEIRVNGENVEIRMRKIKLTFDESDDDVSTTTDGSYPVISGSLKLKAGDYGAWFSLAANTCGEGTTTTT
jgi:hypothetical protein